MLTLAAAVIALNHLYVALDHETYTAVAASPQVRRIAPFEERTTVRKDRTYSGVYLYGENTYLEFIDASQQPEEGAFGFGLDASLANFPIPLMTTQSITRRLGDADVPWFTMALPKEAPPFLWLMQYDPRFLAQWHPEKTKDREPTRATVLRRYKSVIAPAANPVMRDITAIHMILSAEDERALRRFLERTGAPDVALYISVGPSTQGVTRIEMAAAHPVDPMRIGRTRFACDHWVCVWKF